MTTYIAILIAGALIGFAAATVLCWFTVYKRLRLLDHVACWLRENHFPIFQQFVLRRAYLEDATMFRRAADRGVMKHDKQPTLETEKDKKTE